MRKSALAVLSLSLLAGIATAPLAHAADPLATVAWTDGTHQNVRISWPAHDGPTSVTAESVSGKSVLTAGSTASELVVSKGQLLPGLSDVVVKVRDVASGAVVAQSVQFDTFGSVTPQIDQPAKLAADGTITISWTLTPEAADNTPKDPLDLPVTSAAPQLTGTNGCTWKTLPAVSGQRGSAVLPRQTPPYRVRVLADDEWGGRVDRGFVVGNFVVSQQVPQSTPYGDEMKIPVTTDLIRPGNCVNGVANPAFKVGVRTLVDLQTRATSTAGWKSGGVTLPPGEGPIVFRQTSLGARQYRLAAYNSGGAAIVKTPEPGAAWAVGYSAVTAAASATTPYKLLTAKFSAATVTLGQKATAMIGIRPYTNVTATLQKLSGSTWTTVGSVPVRSGDGTYAFTPTARGAATYRFLVPSSTYGGLKIDWIATGGFPLTVR